MLASNLAQVGYSISKLQIINNLCSKNWPDFTNNTNQPKIIFCRSKIKLFLKIKQKLLLVDVKNISKLKKQNPQLIAGGEPRTSDLRVRQVPKTARRRLYLQTMS